MQSAAAVELMSLLISLLHQRLTMFFGGPDNLQKMPIPLGVSGPSSSSYTLFPGPTESATQKVTNRQTDRRHKDHATPSVAIGCI